MENHLKFLAGGQIKFLLEVQKKSGLSTNELAKLAGVVPRSYRDWKREKVNISAKVASIFCKKFGVRLREKKGVLLARWKNARLRASKIGGLARIAKYGSPGTFEGRSKGGKKALQILREKGVIPYAKNFLTPSVYNVDLAEMVGILLGDGGLSNFQVVITLNGEADAAYIPYVRQLGKTLFGEKAKIYHDKKSKAVDLCYSGVNLVRYLLKVGLTIGNKTKYQVDVPTWVKRNNVFRLACLRGLMDTDGGVFLHKYKVGGKIYKYKKICFSNRSIPLLIFVKDTLERLGLTPKLVDKVANKKVWLYNIRKVERYLNLVGTHNPRLLKYQNVEGGPDGKAQVC